MHNWGLWFDLRIKGVNELNGPRFKSRNIVLEKKDKEVFKNQI
jgi:hypothetical protein